MKYISIDGDDIGRKITSYYLSNSEKELAEISSSLIKSTVEIKNYLEENGFSIIFCAADGIVASTKMLPNFGNIFSHIKSIPPDEITFSAGVGENLREAYMALLSAKCNGKNQLHMYSDLLVQKKV